MEIKEYFTFGIDCMDVLNINEIKKKIKEYEPKKRLLGWSKEQLIDYWVNDLGFRDFSLVGKKLSRTRKDQLKRKLKYKCDLGEFVHYYTDEVSYNEDVKIFTENGLLTVSK